GCTSKIFEVLISCSKSPNPGRSRKLAKASAKASGWPIQEAWAQPRFFFAIIRTLQAPVLVKLDD
ncbi:MAG: hypothetical protein ACKOAU_00840, partial [Pirellula sp.]